MKDFGKGPRTAARAGLAAALLVAWLTVVPGLSMDVCSRSEPAATAEEEGTSYRLWIVDFIESLFA